MTSPFEGVPIDGEWPTSPGDIEPTGNVPIPEIHTELEAQPPTCVA